MKKSFVKELSDMLNCRGIDNELGIPDWKLAEYLVTCLAILKKTEGKKLSEKATKIEIK